MSWSPKYDAMGVIRRGLIVLIALSLASCSERSSSNAATSKFADERGRLVGVFGIDAADCNDSPVPRGSYFRLLEPGGVSGGGPYTSVYESNCVDQTYIPLEPGLDGGLSTVDYQPEPEIAFDEATNSLAERITKARTFYSVNFGLSTNPVDPVTRIATIKPFIEVNSENRLTGDLSALTVGWGGMHFNQGSPKPTSTPNERTKPVNGTFDPETGRYVLNWSSQINGGPLDGYLGEWHLEGTFTKR